MRASPILFAMLFCCYTDLIQAQQTINSTGGITTITGNNFWIEYSVGEVVTATTGFHNEGYYFTAGVIQPRYDSLQVNSVKKVFDELYFLSAFPNPVTNQLNIESNYSGFKWYQLTNLLGQIVASGEFAYSPIDLSSTQQGMYFLTLASINEQFTKTIKIIKE